MLKKAEIVKRILAFGLVVGILLTGTNYFVKPIWSDWNNYDTIQGFYMQPKNTIETIFLGSSVTCNGIIPMELYKDYGTCAYNLGTESQPILASYYWLEEAYRFHSKSLRTVVLDTSMLRRCPDKAFYRKALDSMHFSKVKYNAVKDYADSGNEVLSYLIPIFSYHDRWETLTKTDFIKKKYEINKSVRGYNFVISNVLGVPSFLEAVAPLSNTIRLSHSFPYKEFPIPVYKIDEEASPSTFDAEAMLYLKKIIRWCNHNNIKLILMKSPAISNWVLDNWTNADHNAVQKIADDYKLDFLDFNFAPYIDEIQYNHVTDSADGSHMNYYGAKKLTKWLGNYLVQNCGNTDVRGKTRYCYLENELSDYYRMIAAVELSRINNPCEYISTLMEKSGYTIFVSVRDDAASALTDEQREYFADIGLVELAQISVRDAYLAVIDNGKVLYEEVACLDEEKIETEEPLEISYRGTLTRGIKYSVTSGGFFTGDISSCKIDNIEYSPNSRGLNIIVYDNKKHKVVDSTVFDTSAASIRSSLDIELALRKAEEEGKCVSALSENEKTVYLYNRRCEAAKKVVEINNTIGNGGLKQYLDMFWQDENCTIFISAMDDAAGALDIRARNVFSEMGLQKLSELSFRDSYLAVISGGNVISELRNHETVPLELNQMGYSLISGGADSGNTSSIKIKGVEYSPQTRGLNVVVYDNLTESVIDSRTFDTCAIPVNIPDNEISSEVQ